MTRTKLVYSTLNYKNCPKPLVYEPTVVVSACGRFLTAVWEDAKRKHASKRLTITKAGYVYTPSEEWTEKFIRFKNITK
jgi:hypothetical protein